MSWARVNTWLPHAAPRESTAASAQKAPRLRSAPMEGPRSRRELMTIAESMPVKQSQRRMHRLIQRQEWRRRKTARSRLAGVMPRDFQRPSGAARFARPQARRARGVECAGAQRRPRQRRRNASRRVARRESALPCRELIDVCVRTAPKNFFLIVCMTSSTWCQNSSGILHDSRKNALRQLLN